MAKSPLRVVVDTNVYYSALMYGGRPLKILSLILLSKVFVVVSHPLLSELRELLQKKSGMRAATINEVIVEIESLAIIVQPRKAINAVRDAADNKVIEAAVEGECDYVITGDNDLLVLGKYANMKIITPAQFLDFNLD